MISDSVISRSNPQPVLSQYFTCFLPRALRRNHDWCKFQIPKTLPKKVPLKLLSGLEYLTEVYSGTGWAQELRVGGGVWNTINVFVPRSLEIYIFKYELEALSQKCVLVVLIIYLLSFLGKQGPKILHPPWSLIQL